MRRCFNLLGILWGSLFKSAFTVGLSTGGFGVLQGQQNPSRFTPAAVQTWILEYFTPFQAIP